ncbi:DoxX family protein [Nitrosopumilus sp. K4]|uniref:DoxX family protein n=1 Tax=Nitrosopumilus sp. K4 TaxID=2795383 RepID=UPI001BAD8891|nr:DoxX family protein [Nitrosopumilus sp. K4]QUC65577.1 DoxX family protein [Nitrosopumilus sp. K4]
MATSEISKKSLVDISFMGLRSSIGVIFIVAGMSKLGNPGFGGFLSNIGLPAEMHILIALAEIVPGILLIIGVLSRISASLLSIIMLGAIFLVKEAQSLTGDGGYRIDLILLAACLVIIAGGPGRVSLSHIVKKLPRCLH